MFGKLGIMSLVAMTTATGCGVEQLDPESEAKPVVPEEWSTVESAIVYGGHDDLFVTTPKTWDEAQTYCQLAGGYSLVTINDSAEESFLQTQELYRGLYSWWIGANDKGLEGAWVWSNGTSSYSNWYPGEPNNAGGVEDCAVDRFSYPASGIYDERWNDSACSTPFPFICERDPAPTGNMTEAARSAACCPISPSSCRCRVRTPCALGATAAGLAAAPWPSLARVSGSSLPVQGDELAGGDEAVVVLRVDPRDFLPACWRCLQRSAVPQGPQPASRRTWGCCPPAAPRHCLPPCVPLPWV
jgi:hypothetical protein